MPSNLVVERLGNGEHFRVMKNVDDFGRLYIPNAITYSVSLRDNADNEIVSFGDYGNFDCQGECERFRHRGVIHHPMSGQPPHD